MSLNQRAREREREKVVFCWPRLHYTLNEPSTPLPEAALASTPARYNLFVKHMLLLSAASLACALPYCEDHLQ